MDDFLDTPRDDDVQALYDRAPCGYLSMTPDGMIIRVNDTFLAWTGYEREDLVGQRMFVDLLTVGGRLFHETHYAPMLRLQGRAREIALDIVCSDGRRLPALVNSTLERDEISGEPHVIRAAILDATERRLYEQQLVVEKARAETSEAKAQLMARTLQQTLIPPAVPTIAGLDVAALYRPAGSGDEIGGDFYDVFQIASDQWVVAIGDVQGKGVDAAVVTALARYTIRAAAVDQGEPSAVLRTLNNVLLADPTDRLCTAAVIRLVGRGDQWRASISCGGHPLPLLRLRDGAVTEAGRPGTLLGFYADAVFHDCDFDLRSGDTLLAYTDGVSEARQATALFGESRIAETLARNWTSSHELTGYLLGEVLEFQGHVPRDDIAIVVVRVR
jgi:sigma-B regulation protein RsbU (phosphoserine phosphatase)